MSLDSDVVIIGAPRSGTNMLRDVLTSLPGFATWPCDEVNLTWRHGNRAHPSDELSPSQASNKTVSYLRREFDRIRRKYAATSVVEKTCANSLRVEFVRQVKPDARFIFITRDGMDAAASAIARWNAPLNLRYTAAKAKYVPPTDLPYYGTRFVANQLQKRGSGSEPRATVGWWGPKPSDWRELSGSRPLDEVSVIQWQRCVQTAQRGLSGLSSDQLCHVSYESFVKEPQDGLREVLSFLNRPELFDPSAVAGVSASSIGKGRASLSDESRMRLGALAGRTLEGLGYVS